MTLTFEALRLRSSTAAGEAVFEARFGSQLTVIRGGNTIGKSLLVQGLLYGVGLEALYASRKGVLTRAMSSEIDIDGVTYPVDWSSVEVVVTNHLGQSLTVRRLVKSVAGNVSDTDRIETWPGDLFGQTERPQSDDYLVGRPGVATEERGFYRFLSAFLRWDQPMVSTYSGRSVPLYLQVIFGLAYVDQKRGWGGTVPQVPTNYQIVEPLRKAVEFVLDLDVMRDSQDRRRLTEQQRSISSQEQNLRGRLDGGVRLHGGRVVFPTLGSASEQPVPVSTPQVEVLVGDSWMSLNQRIEELRVARSNFSRAVLLETPRSVDAAALEAQLGEAEARLATASARLEALNQEDYVLHVQLGALGRRINALDDEYERYRQLDALQRLGSEIAPHTMEDGDCPTCHQSLEAVESIEGNSLPIAETREAIRQDRATVKSLLYEADSRSETLAARRASWTTEVSSARLSVRSLKTDLTAADGTPSSSDIQATVERDQELARLSNLEAQTLEDADSWINIANELVRVESALAQLGREEETAEDRRRREAWNVRLREELDRFGFESTDPSSIDIDASMKPVVDGYDIGFQGSASDAIRLRWAYLISLLETAALVGGAHPGVLVLDEPGQQGVERDSLAALYRKLLETSLTSGQVFVTTSETPATVESWIGKSGYLLIDLGQAPLMKFVR